MCIKGRLSSRLAIGLAMFAVIMGMLVAHVH